MVNPSDFAADDGSFVSEPGQPLPSVDPLPSLPDSEVDTSGDWILPHPLHLQYDIFAAEYLVDLDPRAAALRAGFRPAAGARLLLHPDVAIRVEQGIAQRLSRVQITQDTVLHEVSLLALSNVEHYVITDDGQVQPTAGAPLGVMRAIQSIKRKTTTRSRNGETTVVHDVELKLWDKPAPLKLMGRHVGLFADRLEHTGRDGGPIETVTKVETVIVDPKSDDDQSNS